MADISNFLISWWYSPTTKMAINYTTTGATQTATNLRDALGPRNGLSDTTDENYHFENMITDHPVENATSIADNIIIKPKIITITGFLTAIGALPIIGPLPSLGILDFNKLGNAVKALTDLCDSKKMLTLTTGLYFGTSVFKKNNVVIQSVDIPRNNQYGRTSIKFTVVFKEVIITNSDANLNSKSSQGVLATTVGGPNG